MSATFANNGAKIPDPGVTEGAAGRRGSRENLVIHELGARHGARHERIGPVRSEDRDGREARAVHGSLAGSARPCAAFRLRLDAREG